MSLILTLDAARRILFFQQGGCVQQRIVKPFGWVAADDEEWTDAADAIASFSKAIENLQLSYA
jgi:hypothetical protein